MGNGGDRHDYNASFGSSGRLGGERK